ncbi:MAG: PspA/IM30 family protein [Myxococcales bacterium]|nr:PspA/IM30 family protein [Myxococcales bacterium]
MSLWERIKRIARANTRPLLERQEDPEQSLRLLEEELSANQREIQRSLEEAYVALRHLEKQRDAHTEEATKWEERAMRALQAGEEALAREALREKAQAEGKANAIQEELDLHQQSTNDLKTTQQQLHKQLEQAKRQHARLEDRLRSQKAMKLMQETAKETSPHAEESDFQRIHRDIEAQEERAQLDAQDPNASALWFDQKLQAKEHQVQKQRIEADAALAALKKRMKKD